MGCLVEAPGVSQAGCDEGFVVGGERLVTTRASEVPRNGETLDRLTGASAELGRDASSVDTPGKAQRIMDLLGQYDSLLGQSFRGFRIAGIATFQGQFTQRVTFSADVGNAAGDGQRFLQQANAPRIVGRNHLVCSSRGGTAR
jgi:hypothetical protein